MTRRSDIDIHLVALLSAVAIFLSSIEYMIPKPIPFMRLGIANLPLILALGMLTWREYFLLAVLKIVGQGIITGSLFSYIILFSSVGTIMSAVAMFATYIILKKQVSRIGISVMGGLFSSLGQLLISRILFFREATYVIAPLFLFSALISSVILGIFSELFIKRSTWYASQGEKRI